MWVVGGVGEYPNSPKDPDTAKNICLSIQPKVDGDWRKEPRLNLARAGHALLARDGFLFALGGYGDGSVPNDRVAKSIEVLLGLPWEGRREVGL